MDGEASDRYDAWPERLYIVLNGVVVYKGWLISPHPAHIIRAHHPMLLK